VSGNITSQTLSRRSQGFTLAELLVAVAIVGLLAVITYPSYVNQVIRGNRSAAQQFMLDIATAEAQYQIDARAYVDVVAAGGLGLSPPGSVANNYTVTIALTAGPPPGYVITATPLGRQAQDGALTLDSLGNKGPVGKW
jgi:type IV pilus assembly protein PilE